jgi:hypothetical protein
MKNDENPPAQRGRWRRSSVFHRPPELDQDVKTLLSLLAVAALLLGAHVPARGQEPANVAGRNDIVYSTEVKTPHVPWATRLPGGPIKGFFIPSVSRGRDMVELMQRLALEPTTVTIDRNWDVNCWGIGDFYGHEYRGDRDDFEIVHRYVEEELTGAKPFEVMLIPGLNGWSRLTRASRDAILRRVQEGAGLVLIHPFVGDVKGHPFRGDEATGDTRIWDVSPLVNVPDDFVSERGYPELNQAAITQGRWERAAAHYITEGVPLDLIPSRRAGGRLYKYEPRGDVLVEAGGFPVLAVKRHGKGRVAAFAYVEDGFLPEGVDPVESRVYWNYWEYQYALLLRSLLWAAGRDSGTSLAAPKLGGDGSAPIELVLASDRPREVELEITGRSELGSAGPAHRERRTLGAGKTRVSIPAAALRPTEGWPGGRWILDAIVREASSGATLDWASATRETPKAATVTGIRPNASVYRRGDTMSLVTRAAGPLEGLKMRVEVRDDLGRLVHAEEKSTPGERYFFYRLDDFVGKRALVAASLVEAGGRVVDQLRAAPLVVVQKERRQKEYQGQLSFETPIHYQSSVRLRRLREWAMDSGFTWGGSVNDSLDVPRGYFGVYWYDRGPTTPAGLEKAIAEYERSGDFGSLQYLTKKELYRRTGDKKFLVRSPSLDDPAVLGILADVSRAAARNKAVYNMDYYFVGDEGSLASYTDPVDFCWGPHTLARFRKWLQEQYGSLEALNRAWKAAYSDWDAVVPLTTEEAKQSGNFPPWADHRTYMEVSFARAYRVVRDAVVEGDEDGHIALSGTQVTTPWDGCDWFRLDQVIDDFLSYNGGNQWDLHRSFAKPGARVGFWTGYGRRGVGVQHEIWSAALQGVLFPNLFWSPSVVNPDLTFSRSGRDMGSVFQSLRFGGIGKLLMESQRQGDGMAVHYSMPSVHAAGILGFHERGKKDDDDPGFPANRDGWVKGLTDLGLGFDFLSSEQVAGGALDPSRLRVFVLPLSLAVAPKEAEALETFVRGGGIAIADGAPGLLDEHCAWRPEGLVNALFGVKAPASDRRSLTGTRPSGTVTVTPEGKAWGLDPDSLAEIGAFETGVAPAGSQPLLEIGGTPAVFARRVGRGWALYLNVLFDRYPELRRKAYGGEGYRSLLSALLTHLGVRPAAEVRAVEGRLLGPTRIARYRFGESDIVAVLTEPVDVAKAYGRDGVTVYDDARLGPSVKQDVEIRLPREGEVVDARTGASLGRTARVRATVAPGDALVLAVSASRGQLSLSGPEAARRGEHPRFKLSSSSPGRRLVRCHVTGPDGQFRAEYARNLVVDGGEDTFVLPTVLDDEVGLYRVTLTDVLDGAAAEASLRLR